MRIMKLEEHLYFPSGFKNVSCAERLHSVWVRSKSGSRSSAIKRAQHWEETATCLAWLVSRPGLLLTGLQAGSPGPSCVSRLRHSDQQRVSRLQGAPQTPTPLLSYWAASGTKTEGWTENSFLPSPSGI